MTYQAKLGYSALLIVVLFLSACAPKEFDSATSSSVGIAGNGDNQGAGGGTNQNNNGDGGSGEAPVAGSKPKVEIRIPSDCVANSICRVYSILTVSTGETVGFDWATNDTAYTQNPALIAEPNKHYVPTGGVIQITETQNRQDMPIQALSNFTRILIPFRWMNCKLDGQPVSCTRIDFSAVAL